MSKTLRLFLFLMFVLAFIVSAPLVVLYTAGYRLDLAHGRIVHTAVLNIASVPRNATVFVDDTRFSDLTPAVLENILPGNHLVRLEKEGYLPWEATVSLESNEARIIGPILLFTDESPSLQESFEARLVSVHDDTDRFAYLMEQSSWLEVLVVDANRGERKLLMRLPFSATDSYNLSWSKDGTYLALIQQRANYQEMFISRVQDGTAIDVSKWTQKAQRIWWDVSSDVSLYVKTQEGTTQIHLDTLATNTFDSTVDLVTAFGDRIITLSSVDDRVAVWTQSALGVPSIITYLPLGDYVFVEAPEGVLALSDSRRQRLILIDPNNQQQPILFNETSALWDWDSTGDTLAYSSGYDLKRYVRSRHETETLTRLSTPLERIQWAIQGSTIVYQSDGELVALTLDDATILSRTSLAEELTGTFWIHEDGTRLSSLKQNEQTWEWWIRVLRD